MRLIIDQGNTRLKIALFHKDQIIEIKSFNNTEKLSANEIIQDFESQYKHLGKITSGISSSVGPRDNEFIDALSTKIKLFVLTAKLNLPIILKYATPDTLGNDRIALATAGSASFPESDVLVIDAGTCITYDFINCKKEYFGGAISPGIWMRFKALNTFTSNLPLVPQIKNPDLIGNTTLTSIQSGVINGIKAEVMGIIKQYKLQYPSLTTVFTGGDLNYFDKNTKSNIFAIPNLVLLGLKEILEHNAKS